MKGKFRRRQLFAATLVSMVLQFPVTGGEPWALYGGYSSVNQDKAYSFFYFPAV